MKIINTMSANESKFYFDIVTHNCTLQVNGSYLSDNGRLIWTSIEGYKTANISNTKTTFVKKKTTKKKKK